jgi:cell division protease FtsH
MGPSSTGLTGPFAALRRLGRRGLVAAGAGVIVLGAGAWALTASQADAPAEVSLTDAQAAVAAGTVVAAELDAGSALLTDAAGVVTFTTYPADYADELTADLLAEGVDVTTARASVAEDVAGRVVPVVLVVGVLLLLLRVAAPGALRGSRGRKPLAQGDVPTIGFDDVAGADEAVDQLREIVALLREPARFAAVGAGAPRGALLVGPPGTGKTLLARAVAGEAGVPFFALAGSDFVESYVGVGARRVRDLFSQARKAGQAIVFIDEIDAVGRARGDAANDGERENTLIALLAEMDGFVGSGVVVLAATNRPDTLDPALVRPGRLDRRVEVPLPDRRGRTLVLEVHTRRRPIAGDVDLVHVARRTPGMSGAELARVVDEACLEAARRGQETVDADCFDAAIATVALGKARTSALVTEHDRTVTAWHEAGHALAAALLPDADDPVSVSIVPRGPAGGVTWMSGNDDAFLRRRSALAQLTVALAGRAAEERLLDGEHTQGAAGDLQSATRLATDMVTRYGMTGFGYAQVDADTLRLGGQVAARAHAEVERLLQDAHAAATALLAGHADELASLAALLLTEETVGGADILRLVGRVPALA